MSSRHRLCADPAFFDDVFAGAEFMTISMIDKDLPYCLPVNFVRKDNFIYIHSALTGLKLECLAANPNVAFSLATDVRIDIADRTTYYKSICGRGLAVLVEDNVEKGAALDMLAMRYKALCKVPSPESNIRRVSIIRIDIQEMTGKSNSPER